MLECGKLVSKNIVQKSTRSSFLVWWAASVCIAIQVRSNLNLNDLDENEDVEGEDALREGPEKYPP